MTTKIPLAVSTFDNTAITFDTVNFTFDGANLINGGASDIKWKPPLAKLSYTVSNSVATQVYGAQGSFSTPLPVLYPPQTFYISGAAINSGQIPPRGFNP